MSCNTTVTTLSSEHAQTRASYVSPSGFEARPRILERLLCRPPEASHQAIDGILLGSSFGGELIDLLLGTPVQVQPPPLRTVVDAGSWQALARDERDEPLTWRADKRIRYAVNPNLGYPGFVDDVTRVMVEVRRLSGLRFDLWGTTSLDCDAFDAGQGPSEVSLLVAWVASRDQLRCRQPAIATGGTDTHFDPELGRTVRYRGRMIFAADYPLAPGFVRSGWGPVIRHEAGHIVGLDHVLAGDEVMRPGSYRDVVNWGHGDIRGLQALGTAAQCETPTVRGSSQALVLSTP